MPLAAAPAIAPVLSPKLEALRWRKRVMVVFAPSPDDPRLREQRREATVLAAGPDDRDLHLVVVAGDRVEGATDAAAELRRRFHMEPAAFRVLLVGKDGGVKLSEAQVVPAPRFAELIDAMPMRRDEMRGR